MERFAACFAGLEDPREDNTRHELNEILMIALCAMPCGAEDCSDMALFGRAKEPFLREFLQLRHGIPSHDTFSRVPQRKPGHAACRCQPLPRRPGSCRGTGEQRAAGGERSRPHRDATGLRLYRHCLATGAPQMAGSRCYRLGRAQP
jgi:hypothetical protein